MVFTGRRVAGHVNVYTVQSPATLSVDDVTACQDITDTTATCVRRNIAINIEIVFLFYKLRLGLEIIVDQLMYNLARSANLPEGLYIYNNMLVRQC